MVWMLGSRPMIVSDVILVVQISCFIVLVYGIINAKSNIQRHGKIATFAFSIAAISALYMIYSSLIGFSNYLPWNIQSLLLVHKILGFIVIILGMVFVFNQWKWKVKRNMIAGLLLWTGALVSGITVYINLFIGI